MRVVPFLMSQDHHPVRADLRQPANQRLVIAEGAVAMELDPVSHQFAHVVERVRASCVTGELHPIPGGQGRSEAVTIVCSDMAVAAHGMLDSDTDALDLLAVVASSVASV